MPTFRYRSWPSGTLHDLQNPEPSRIFRRDVIHHLVRIPRYNGGCVRHYSVAEHSIRVALSVLGRVDGGKRLAYAAVTHDAMEAYIQDLTAPLVAAVPGLVALQDLWGAACDVALEVPPDLRANGAVGAADRGIRDVERRHVLPAVVTDIHRCDEVEPEWEFAEMDLRNLGVLTRPSFRFATAEYGQLETLFATCLTEFKRWQQ